MTRRALTQEEKKNVTLDLVKATRKILFTEGIDAVTIRKTAAHAQLNSATIYKYFSDIEELILFTCVDLLRDYAEILAAELKKKQIEDTKELYLTIWKVFGKYSFQHADCLNYLFYGTHRHTLQDVTSYYYATFHDVLSDLPEKLQDMFRLGSIKDRNLELLSLVFNNNLETKKLNVMGRLTISYYQMMLNEAIQSGKTAESNVDDMVDDMLYACEEVLSLATRK